MPEGPPPAASLPSPAPGRPAPPARGPRPWVAAAWGVVALVFVAVQAAHLLLAPDPEETARFVLEVMRQQVQQQYGTEHLVASLPVGTEARAAFAGGRLDALRGFATGPVAQRQRWAVVAGDLEGPGAAREALAETERLLAERGRTLEGREAAVQEALSLLYAGEGPAGDPDALREEDRALLREDLGWFGDLALAPPSEPETPARRAVLEPTRTMALTQAILVGLVFAGLGTGLLAGILFLILLANGRVRMRFAVPGNAPGGIYAETFAAWMLLFIGLQAGLGLLVSLAAPGAGSLLSGGLSFVGSLAALGWPVLRGVPWSRVRHDIGLHLSPTPVRDALAGAACWLMALPVMAGAFLLTFLLLMLQTLLRGEPDPFEPTPLPSHPVMGEITGGTAWIWIFLLAVVLAPVVEETFFRGVLYRHLRDATGRLGRGFSFLLSAAATGLLFAAIHPQGWAFIPVLAAVAWGLVHAREWRGSLVAPVVCHALHNGIVTLVAFTTLG